jgi:hypothetical protein
MRETNNPNRQSRVDGFNMGFDFSYFLGKNTLKYGVELLGFSTDYVTYSNYGNYEIRAKNYATEIGAYAKYKASLGNFLLEPSLRVQYYASFPEPSIEPRIALKYNVTDNFRIKGAAGRYSQDLVAATSDRDVVNLFYGFLSGVDNLPSYFNGNKITSKLQKANHYVLGTEIDLSNDLTMNIEGYWKQFTQLTNLNRNKIYEDNEENAHESDLIKKDFMVENGDAYGFDLSLKYENKRWYFWGVYALGFVNRNYEKYEGGQVNLISYQPHFDRRHNVNLILTYTAGDQRQWEFSGRWNFGTGFPFTQVQGFYEFLSFQDGIYFDYTTTNGEMGIIFADLNQGRLPTYHRFDINAKRKIFFTERTILEVDLGVTNVYNRANVFYVDLLTSETVQQLPILPSLGLTLSF